MSLLDAVLVAEAELDWLGEAVTVRLCVALGVTDTVRLCVCVCVCVTETDWEGELVGDSDCVRVPVEERVCELDGVDVGVAVADCERVRVDEAD